MERVKAVEKPEAIIIIWLIAFAIILFILTLKFQNYNINIRAVTSALLTMPLAIWALQNIIKANYIEQ
jgi:hypothetical protein